MLWVAGRRAAAPGWGARRVHTSHTSETTRRAGHYEGPSQDPHTPPPFPKPRGDSTRRRDSSCAGNRTHGEEREDGKPLPRQHPTHGKAREREAGSKQRNAGLAHLRQPGDQRIGGTVPWGQKGARPTSAQDTQRKAEQARTHNHTHRPRLRTVQRRLGSPPRAGLTGVHRSNHACKGAGSRVRGMVQATPRAARRHTAPTTREQGAFVYVCNSRGGHGEHRLTVNGSSKGNLTDLCTQTEGGWGEGSTG
jgi:hypothetical protein